MSLLCLPAATEAAIYWRCSPAATTSHAWFLRIASGTATPRQAWHGMSITYCINFKTSGTRRDLCRALMNLFRSPFEKPLDPLGLSRGVHRPFTPRADEFLFFFRH